MKNIAIESFLKYQFVSDPTLSPDGAHTAFLVHHADVESNGYQSYLHLLCHQTGETKKLTACGTVKGFSWMDNTTLLFPSKRCPATKEALASGEQLTQYYTIDITGGEGQPAFTLDLLAGKLTHITGTKYLTSAPYDNNRPNLEGLSKAERLDALKKYNEKGYTIFEEVPFWDNGQGVTNRKRNRLYIVDLADNSVTPITDPLFHTRDFDVSSTHILYQGAAYEDFRPNFSGLYLYTVATGETTCLVEPHTLCIKLALLYGTDKAVLAYGTSEQFGLTQNGDVYLFDLATKSHTHLAHHDHAPIGNNSTGSDARYGGGTRAKIAGDTLYYLTTSVNHSYLNALNLTTGAISTLTTDGSADAFDVGTGRTIFVAMKGDALGELYTLAEGAEQKLTALNDFMATDYTISTPAPITCTARDGMDIFGYVMKPTGYVAGNSYPAILHIHGGPRTVFSSIFHHEMQMWANEGYFVFYCNPRGSDGRGNEFADLTAKYGTVDFDDIMDFTDTVLASYGDIDQSRVGVTGGSYGGFMTNWIIGHTHRFKVACAQRSIANWTSFEGTTDIGTHFAPDQIGASHTENQALQWKQSPLCYADKATTPTLFIHSEEDYRCWMVEGLQMFTALKMHGTPARLCLLKGENHDLSRTGRPRNRIKRMEEILTWMNQYLK